MAANDRSVLILGDELSLVERFVPLLRRSNLSVQRLLRPSGPIQLAEEAPRDLIVVVPPLANADRLFARARAEGSPWRHTGVLLIAERSERTTLDPALTRFANRMVSPGASPDEIQSELAELLEVAPRVAVHASVQLKLVPPEGGPKRLPVENLSSTGMFVALDEPLPVGTVFGFALELPSEREPILGQAGVVRRANDPGPGRSGNGVRFLSLGGEGAERLERLVRHQRERTTGSVSTAARAKSASSVGSSGSVTRPAAVDLATLKEELAELESLLNERLIQGLARRLGAADWYLTGMELGLDSLHAFSALLEAIHSGRTAAFETQSRIADLALVRQKLVEFSLPQQELRQRIQTMLDLRPPLDRLRRQFAEPGAAGAQPLPAARPPEVVFQSVAEIRRLIGTKRSLESVRALLLDLGGARYLFSPAAQRRIAERIAHEHRAVSTPLGFATPEALASRNDRKRALLAVERELGALGQRLAAIHEKLYAKRFRHLGTSNVESDLSDPKSLSILAETLAPGRDYLDRAYSAYRHALEIAGADPDLLDRAAALAATIRAAEREQSAAMRSSPPTASNRGA